MVYGIITDAILNLRLALIYKRSDLFKPQLHHLSCIIYVKEHSSKGSHWELRMGPCDNLLNVCRSEANMSLSFRRRDFSMQTFICPACSLVFVPRFWASDGCSHSPFAPAVQWAAPTDYWPVCAGSAPQRAGAAVYCQPGTLGTATHTIYSTLIHTLIQIHTHNLTHTPKHTRTQWC